MALFISLFFSVSLVHADTLLINSVKAEAGVAKPSAGMTMDKVISRFGEPQSRSGAVGDPPITSWTYPGFTVYFEYQHVIHAVVPH